jgi:methylglyoxal synthase
MWFNIVSVRIQYTRGTGGVKMLETLEHRKHPMTKPALRIALVAHDAKKADLVAWVGQHIAQFRQADLFTTGTTGTRLLEAHPDLRITRLKSGPLGGDQQLGAMISEDGLDALIFFIDPMSPMPHDVDVKALNRLAVVYDLPLANSTRTAELITEGLFDDWSTLSA